MIDVSTAELDRAFGRETVRRARAYVDEGHVLECRQQGAPGSLELSGRVQGTRPSPYDVTVRVAAMRRGTEVWSVCTCPVRLACKHGAALVVSAQQAPGSARARRWALQLDDALSQLETKARAATVAPVPLGLQVDLKVNTYQWQDRPVRTIRLRPVQRGKLGRWIKTGVDWHQVPGLGYRGEHDPGQVELLAELATVLGPAYGGVGELGRTGAALWPMLRRAAGIGLELVPGAGLSEIVVLGRAVAVTADLRTSRDATEAGPAGLELDLGIVDPGAEAAADLAADAGAAPSDQQHWPGERVELLGQPAHGVALLDAPAGDVMRSGPERGRQPAVRLTLAPLDRFVPDAVEALFRRSDSVHVPDADREDFVADYVPRLRRHLVTRSSDGTVPLPEEKPPRLVLELEWLGPGRAAGSFGWDYHTGAQRRRFALDSGAGLADVRRLETESAHLAALGLDEAARELLCDSGGRLRPELQWRGDRLLRFVAEVLPELRDHPGIVVEETGAQPNYRPATGAPQISFEPTDRAAGEDEEAEPTRTDWLDLEVLIRVDGEQLALGTILTALTRGESRVFTPSGLHVPTDHPAFAQLAELVRDAGELVDQPAEGLRVGRRDLDTWAELDELGVVDEAATAWLDAARVLRATDRLPDVEPVGLVNELRGYQHDGFRWLAFLWRAGLGGVLADDMGLGKTLQALALVAHARAHGAAPFLVVAPTSVVTAWAGEVSRHAPGLVVRVVEGTSAKRGEKLAEIADGADLVVTSYTLLRLEADAYAEQEWGGLICDEAQHVKNHQAKTHRAVRAVPAPFRLALTGTPFENRLMELWSLLAIVAPGLYPSPQRFREVVVRPVERGDRQALDRLRRRMRPFLLRRTKQLVATDMPPKQEQLLEVSLGPRHRRIYDTHLQRERQTVLGLVGDFDRHRIAIFRSLTRLRQLSLDPALLDPAHEHVASVKVEVLVDHLRELVAEGHRALVFSQFTSFLRRVRARLEREGIATCYLDGRTRNRQRVIEEFREGEAPAFLISLKAGGVGLTLTEADYVFVLDPWWNPAVEAQAVDRAHRIGQQRPVMVYRLVATDTIEEKVVALKERKADLFAQVIDGGGAADVAVGADDVRALFED